MKNTRYRKKHRYNALKIFVVMALFMVLLGYIVVQRGRNLDTRDESRQRTAASSVEDRNEEKMKKILADEKRYP